MQRDVHDLPEVNPDKDAVEADLQPPTPEIGIKGPPDACLFVANIDRLSTPQLGPFVEPNPAAAPILKRHFEQYGAVLKVKLMNDKMGGSYAFVQFSDLLGAEAALKDPESRIVPELGSQRIRIEKARMHRTLFLAKLGRQVQAQELKAQLEQFGPVESVLILKDHKTNLSKGCGFVKFLYREDAVSAFVSLKASRQVVVEWSTSDHSPESMGIDRCALFIGGLNPLAVTEEALREHFGQHGVIEQLTLNIPPINQPDSGSPGAHLALRSAYAHIRYSDPLSATQALEQEQGAMFLGRPLRVQYSESDAMKHRRRHMTLQFCALPTVPAPATGSLYPPGVGLSGVGGPSFPGIPLFAPISAQSTRRPVVPTLAYAQTPYGAVPVMMGPGRQPLGASLAGCSRFAFLAAHVPDQPLGRPGSSTPSAGVTALYGQPALGQPAQPAAGLLATLPWPQATMP
ncbi:putative RNA-binding protein msa1 [Paratrimastix pyriformis]|uniref:RNA-binding protein msa1 n=1 Tax=Paratrimastix pyriformis TaxID=342808 RepID=A0ABQ8UE46_9EUKA|nr:putative RNA-binding protein msa1 [Paratrimastix pyriformis]